MNTIKSLVRRNCSVLNLIARTSFYHKQLHEIRTRLPAPQFTERYLEAAQKRQGLTKMPNKFIYVAKPNSEISLNRKKMQMLGVGHSLKDDFKSEKERARWSQFRRKMIYGSFAV